MGSKTGVELKKKTQVLKYQKKLLNYRASNQLHTRLLSKLVSQFGGNLHKYLIDYLLHEEKQKMPLKIDLCLQWLFNEYQMAIETLSISGKSIIDSDSNYNTCFCVILKILCDPDKINREALDNENLFVYVVLRAPVITYEAWKEIRRFCDPETGCQDVKIVSNMLQNLSRRNVTLNYKQIAEICILLCTQPVSQQQEKLDLERNVKNRKENTIVEMTLVYKKAPKTLKNIIEEKYLHSWLDMLRDTRPPMSIVSGEKDMEWNEDLIIRIICYFLNIIPLNPQKLLMDLAKIFATAASTAVQRFILRAIPVHVEKLGINSDAVLNLVRKYPPGSEMLVLRIIHILTESILSEQPANDFKEITDPTNLLAAGAQVLAGNNQVPSAALAENYSNQRDKKKSPVSSKLIEAMIDLYQSKEVQDIRYLTPVLSFLSYSEIVEYLPELNFLVAPSDSREAVNNAIKGIKVCFGEKSVFSQDIIARTLTMITECLETSNQNLRPLHRKVKRGILAPNEPPTLSMRTFIQAILMYPKLRSFIINLLKRILKTGKITDNKYTWLWNGFVKCCQKLKSHPECYELILSLDSAYFFKIMDELKSMRIGLIRYIEDPNHFYVKNSLTGDKLNYLLECQRNLNAAGNNDEPEPAKKMRVEPVS